jgi:hypothetical protein
VFCVVEASVVFSGHTYGRHEYITLCREKKNPQTTITCTFLPIVSAKNQFVVTGAALAVDVAQLLRLSAG